MALRRILIHPDPRLKAANPPAEDPTALRGLAEDMLETMYQAPGIGLAAPQIGVATRMFVMDCTEKDAPEQPMVLINPRITWASETLNSHDEGCLSIPDIYEPVTRPAEVQVAWTDLDGETQEAAFDGLWATCAQHEIDHLDGRLFIDHISALKRRLITQKMKKLKRGMEA
ncbi:MAG: peptide deformylase [Pseudomonadota bacterium]